MTTPVQEQQRLKHISYSSRAALHGSFAAQHKTRLADILHLEKIDGRVEPRNATASLLGGSLDGRTISGAITTLGASSETFGTNMPDRRVKPVISAQTSIISVCVNRNF